MKKYEKTQAKISKILVILLVAAFIYSCFGIEFLDLSWETNKYTYKLLLGYIAIFLGMGLDHWYAKRKQQHK